MKHRPFVIVESPYANGDIAKNLIYLKRCLRDSWERGEHPLASHGYYPFFLSEKTERREGIEAGYAMWPLAGTIIFYSDYGMSEGMKQALDRAMKHQMEILTRTIGMNP